MKKPKLFFLVGVAASGKSTVANNIKVAECNNNAVILSSDLLREELLGNINDQSKNGWIFEQMNMRLRECLKSGYDVIYDATNLSMKRRMALLQSLTHIPCEKLCYVVVATIETLYNRDAMRDRHIGKEVIDKQVKQFQCPQYFEGWDEIHFVSSEQKDFDNVHYMCTLLDNCHMPHDNPHHAHWIDEHMELVGHYLDEHYCDRWLWFAGRYHDIGKPFCKSLYNARGQRDEDGIYHYIGHQNAGAYMELCYWIPYFKNVELIDNIMYVIGLINYHMEKWIRKEAYYKFEKLIDSKLASGLEKLYEADREAH